MIKVRTKPSWFMPLGLDTIGKDDPILTFVEALNYTN